MDKYYTLKLNHESAKLLLEGVESLPAGKKNTVVYKNLHHNLRTIVTLWERRIKNEKIAQDARRQMKKSKKGSKSYPQPPQQPPQGS